MDIWVAKYEKGDFQVPELLPALNSDLAENDLCIDPQDRFLILNRYVPEDNSINLWISFKEGKVWQKPILLEKINQPDVWELTPYVSPDGRHFLCEIDGEIRIWQVDDIHGIMP